MIPPNISRIFCIKSREGDGGKLERLKKKYDIYVIEIKLDGTADEALKQIEEKGYANPYAMDKRKLYAKVVQTRAEKACFLCRVQPIFADFIGKGSKKGRSICFYQKFIVFLQAEI